MSEKGGVEEEREERERRKRGVEGVDEEMTYSGEDRGEEERGGGGDGKRECGGAGAHTHTHTYTHTLFHIPECSYLQARTCVAPYGSYASDSSTIAAFVLEKNLGSKNGKINQNGKGL
jgi:hypothetical protein